MLLPRIVPGLTKKEEGKTMDSGISGMTMSGTTMNGTMIGVKLAWEGVVRSLSVTCGIAEGHCDCIAAGHCDLLKVTVTVA